MDNRGQLLQGTAVIIAVLVVLTAVVGVMTVETVQEQHEKVVVYKGNAKDTTFKPGKWHVLNPLTTSTKDIDMTPQLYTMVKAEGEGDKKSKDDSIYVTASDNMRVGVDVAVRYRVTDPVKFYSNYRTHKRARDVIIRSPVRDAVYTVGGGVTGDKIGTRSVREEMKSQVKTVLQKEFDGAGITLLAVEIRAVNYPPGYLQSVNQRKQAQQDAKRAEAEAKKQIVRAEANAEEKRIRAEADADAELIRAEAESKANRKIADSLSNELVNYRFIQQLDETDNIYFMSGEGGDTPYLVKNVDDSEGNSTDTGN